MTYEIWDKQSSINGIEAQHFLDMDIINDDPNIILFKEGDVVVRVESKKKLSEWFDISESLPLADFMDAYNQKLNEQKIDEQIDP